MWGNGFGCGLGELSGFGWSGMLFGGLITLLFWGGFLALIFVAVKSFAQPKYNQGGSYSTGAYSSSDKALEVLKERYARGEITKGEYDDVRQTLMA